MIFSSIGICYTRGKPEEMGSIIKKIKGCGWVEVEEGIGGINGNGKVKIKNLKQRKDKTALRGNVPLPMEVRIVILGG